jgi:hypothetical protein
VLPEAVPLRQWVLTFPFELRARFGFDAKLLSEVSGVVNAALLGFYERALGDHIQPAGPRTSTSTEPTRHKRAKLQGGAVTVVQRTSSDLRLNPHLHILALDGVFAEQPAGSLRFVQLPALASIDVAEVLLTIRCRVLRLLARRGVIETADALELLPSDTAERDPVLAQLTAAAVCGQAPAGPERRQRSPLRLVHGKGPTITGPLCVANSRLLAARRHGGRRRLAAGEGSPHQVRAPAAAVAAAPRAARRRAGAHQSEEPLLGRHRRD